VKNGDQENVARVGQPNSVGPTLPRPPRRRQFTATSRRQTIGIEPVGQVGAVREWWCQQRSLAIRKPRQKRPKLFSEKELQSRNGPQT